MKKIVGYDSWKRPIFKDVESLPNYSKKEKVIYNTFDNLPNATPQEIKDWYESELKWWGDRQIPIVAIMAFINQTGCEVSYVLTNQKFKEFAIWQENICLGKKQIIISNEIETTTIEVEDEF